MEDLKIETVIIFGIPIKSYAGSYVFVCIGHSDTLQRRPMGTSKITDIAHHEFAIMVWLAMQLLISRCDGSKKFRIFIRFWNNYIIIPKDSVRGRLVVSKFH